MIVIVIRNLPIGKKLFANLFEDASGDLSAAGLLSKKTLR